MKRDHIRWGIIGAGKIARSFVRDFPLLQNASLVAIAARDKQKASDFAKEYNIPLALNYEELFNSAEIDAVYIATTHNFHFEQAMSCLQHGKAVLAEKPVTVHPKELEKLVQTARDQQVFLMEGLWSFFLPAIQKAGEWLAEGRIGALKLIQADFSFPAVPNDEGRLLNPQLAGGALLDIGIYPIALSSYFTHQQPLSVKASGILTHTGVDATIGILLEYPEYLALISSSIATKMMNEFRLYGESGSIRIHEYWKARNCSLYDLDNNLVESFDDGRQAHGFIFQMQAVTDALLAGKLESEQVPLELSSHWQNTMLEIRRQINFSLPGDSHH